METKTKVSPDKTGLKEKEKKKDGRGESVEKVEGEKEEKKKGQLREVLPKNINNYKHLIDTLLLTGKDIEWVLHLRGYKKGGASISGEEESAGKNSTVGVPPSFFQKDYDHFLETKEKKPEHRLWNHTGNSRDFEHLMSKRVGEKSNPSLLGYETNLRIFPPKCTLKGPSTDWSPPPNKARSTTQIPSFLPPILKSSELNLSKLDKLVNRPLDKVFFDDPTIDLKHIKKKNRKFVRSIKETSGLIGENNSLQPYSLSYSIKNINNFKHFFSESNNSYAQWGADLRTHKDKKGRTSSFEAHPPGKPENQIRKDRRDRIERKYKLK